MYNGQRDVVGRRGEELAVVDAKTDLWGKMRFTAGILKTKLVPRTWCEKVGTFGSEEEARAAAISALTNGGDHG